MEAEADSGLNLFFTLKGPAGETRTVSNDQVDCFTQEKVVNLVRERIAAGLPYFLALAVDEANAEMVADGISFLRNRYKHGKAANPLTQKKITHFRIFESKFSEHTFHFLCDETNLRANHDFFAKYVNAFDPDLAPHIRGGQRFAVGCMLEERACGQTDEEVKQLLLRQAQEMFRLGCQDNSYQCHLRLAEKLDIDSLPHAYYLQKRNHHLISALGDLIHTPSGEPARLREVALVITDILISSDEF